MSKKYINIEYNVVDLLKNKSITKNEIVIYLTLCQHATFKYGFWGVYSKQSYTTLKNSLLACGEKREIIQIQRSIKKMEKEKIITVINKKNELIISLEPNATIDTLKKAIEEDIDAFNLYAKRIKEIEDNLSIKINIKRKEPTAQVNEPCDIPF